MGEVFVYVFRLYKSFFLLLLLFNSRSVNSTMEGVFTAAVLVRGRALVR